MEPVRHEQVQQEHGRRVGVTAYPINGQLHVGYRTKTDKQHGAGGGMGARADPGVAPDVAAGAVRAIRT
jgi:hypothetical protein